MKRALLFLILLLNVGVLPALADTVIVDKTAQSEQEQLELQLPDDTPIGHNLITIEVLDDAGVITSRDVAFCKDTHGDIQWDDNCPDVTDASLNHLEGIFDPALLPDYNPAKDTKAVGAVVVASFALLGAVSTSSTSSSGGSSKQEQPSQESFEGIEAGHRRRIARKQGRGDRSRSWDWPWTKFFDREINETARQFSLYSPLLGRILQDGNYLRAIVGGLAALLYPVAIYIGILALNSNTWQPIPVLTSLMLVIMGIGLIDAFAGFLIGYIFIAGMIVAGHFHTRQQILGSIGIIVIWFAPALIASALRPLRREVKDGDSLWERISDYALAALLTAWVIQKMVGALPGLTGKQLGITSHVNQLAFAAGILVAIRFALEDISDHFYPHRNDEIDIDLKEPGRAHAIYSKVASVAAFFFIAERYIGNSWALWVATLLNIAPFIIERNSDRLPKKPSWGRFMPTGALLILVMIIIGSLISGILSGLISDGHTLLQVSFVVLSLPSLALAIVGHISGETSENSWRTHKRGRIAYRLSGVGVYALLLLVVLGKDIGGWVTHFFN